MPILMLDGSEDSLEATLVLLQQIKSVPLPEPSTEYFFHPTRRWRFDFSWPKEKVALEIEGGLFARKGARKCRVCKQIPRGRHATPDGLMNDLHKYNAAAEMGWRLVRVTPQMVKTGEALSVLKRVLQPSTGELVARR